MIGGAVAGGIALLSLGWAEEIVGVFVREKTLVWKDVQRHARENAIDQTLKQKSRSTIALAVLSMYTIGFVLNTGMYTSGACSIMLTDLLQLGRLYGVLLLILCLPASNKPVQHGVR